jgi:hypothetical protein
VWGLTIVNNTLTTKVVNYIYNLISQNNTIQWDYIAKIEEVEEKEEEEE